MTDDAHAEDAGPAAESPPEAMPPAPPEDRHALERALVAMVFRHIVATFRWMSDAELRTLARVLDDGDALRLALALARARAEDAPFDDASDDPRKPARSVESVEVEDAIQDLIALVAQIYRESGDAETAGPDFSPERWVRVWIEEPNRVLKARPVDLLATDEGRELVRSLLLAQQTANFW